MAHVCQERTFCLIGLICSLLCLSQSKFGLFLLCNLKHRAVGIIGITVAIVDSHTAAAQPTRISGFVNDSEFVFSRFPVSSALHKELVDRLPIIGMNQIGKIPLSGHEIFGGVAGEISEVLAIKYRREIFIKSDAIYSTWNVFNQSRKLLFSRVELPGSGFKSLQTPTGLPDRQHENTGKQGNKNHVDIKHEAIGHRWLDNRRKHGQYTAQYDYRKCHQNDPLQIAFRYERHCNQHRHDRADAEQSIDPRTNQGHGECNEVPDGNGPNHTTFDVVFAGLEVSKQGKRQQQKEDDQPQNQCGRAVECQGQVDANHTDRSKEYRGQQAELAEPLGFDAELAAAGVYARLLPIFLPVVSRRLSDMQACGLFVRRHTVTP